jgi:hypothetical protein
MSNCKVLRVLGIGIKTGTPILNSDSIIYVNSGNLYPVSSWIDQ